MSKVIKRDKILSHQLGSGIIWPLGCFKGLTWLLELIFFIFFPLKVYPYFLGSYVGESKWIEKEKRKMEIEAIFDFVETTLKSTFLLAFGANKSNVKFWPMQIL